MPKSTFFNLPIEKQNRLLEAARIEFSKQPFADVPISNIIRRAEIPRGSFYQYFEDKEDLYFYLISTQRKAEDDRLKQLLTANDGDYFKTMAANFNALIDDMVSGPNADLYRQMFLHMSYHGVSRLAPGPVPDHEPDSRSEQLTYLYEHMNLASLRVKNLADFKMLLGQTVGIYAQTVGHFLAHQAHGEHIAVTELKSRLEQQLNWFQYGVATKEGGKHV
ncbi:TetR/AcrR family transcriptional regulator [Lacticaseibacillus brantae]|uniref:Transcriptional regulator n=1 Tax=Lacticaseibacillus brantae DSM 23927 TaxID=1423727 RepID=A0A0R2B1Q6_9LACO|nr:TetR/AcrR family transcriptional regulator [Lacticaseibacillus brantae]KRM72965.1 transcriptional regulator [Lacticaseibacillus brantae DSM 23927]